MALNPISATLLLLLQVFTPASTLVFKTFACDDAVGDGKSYLRADYRLSCGSRLHTFFKAYAVLMILVRTLARDRVGIAVSFVWLTPTERCMWVRLFGESDCLA